MRDELDRITIPRNTLVVLCGPAGCGKSSFSARHFLPTQVVSSDNCRAMVSDDPTNQGVSGHAFDLMHFIIDKRLRLGRLTVADATNLKREERRWMIRAARYFRFRSAAVVFDIALEICLARNAARSRVVPEEALRSQHELLQATLKTIAREGFDYVFVLDEEAQERVRVEVEVKRRSGRPDGSSESHGSRHLLSE